MIDIKSITTCFQSWHHVVYRKRGRLSSFPFHSITTSNRASESVSKLHDLVNLELCQAYNVREGLLGEFLLLKM